MESRTRVDWGQRPIRRRLRRAKALPHAVGGEVINRFVVFFIVENYLEKVWNNRWGNYTKQALSMRKCIEYSTKRAL
jgi:hypothetical protein